MKLNKKILLGTISSSLALIPTVAISCGIEKDSSTLSAQKNFLNEKARKAEMESLWTKNTISSLYGLDFTKDPLAYEKAMNDKNHKLFKDAYKIFKLYWRSKIASDSQFFLKKEVDWKVEGIQFYKWNNGKFEKTNFSIKEVKEDQVPTEEQFLTLWNTGQTKIRDEVEKFILVDKYLTLENVDQLKKIDKDYEKNSKEYVNKNYNLLKYVINKKPSQLWLGSTTSENGVAGKIQYNPSIKGYEDFNKYVKDAQKAKKMNLEQVADLSSKELEKEKETLEKLEGYQGIIYDDAKKYGLNWDKKDLLANTNRKNKYGFYQPVLGSLITAEELSKNPNGYLVKSGNTTLIAYLMQIAPLSKTFTEKDKDGKDQKVNKFTFEGSLFEKHLDDLSYLLYLKDNSLYETAKSAFYTLGYLLEINDPVLKELYKNEKFIKK
ncbi:MAG: HinT-interacting membrane complex lipoprotein P60 [Metamycoplasmataceae bacterium]|uniref:HinT-interacting membrane complex lipoprotein P60 n=1 Tax=Mycoplasmopsis lipophila TaxID=2117 RepID=UPI003872FB73